MTAEEEAFTKAGFRIERDRRPFAGAMGPLSHYRRDARVRAIMVEVNRRLCMDEPTGERSAE